MNTKQCYICSAHPEDRATLGSDPSAEVGGYTVRQGRLGSALSFQAPVSPRAVNPNVVRLHTSVQVSCALDRHLYHGLSSSGLLISPAFTFSLSL